MSAYPDIIRDWLFTTLSKQYDQDFAKQGLEHFIAVGQIASFLALQNHLDATFALMAGYLHDIAFYTTHYHPYHAKKSAEIAQTVLSEKTDLKADDIQMITQAIRNHSNKETVDDLFCEILKDADVISHVILDGKTSLNEQERKKI